MQGNVEEIVTYMSVKFRTYEVFDSQLRTITRELIERGYTLEEIIKGINTYLLQLEPLSTDSRNREKNPARTRTFRILDESESRHIGPGAYGYLWLMREMGMLSHQETEDIIAYIVESELDVETGDQLQTVMMDLILGQEYYDEFDNEDGGFDEFEDLSLKRLSRRRLN